jgi:hypothetical protein
MDRDLALPQLRGNRCSEPVSNQQWDGRQAAGWLQGCVIGIRGYVPLRGLQPPGNDEPEITAYSWPVLKLRAVYPGKKLVGTLTWVNAEGRPLGACPFGVERHLSRPFFR